MTTTTDADRERELMRQTLGRLQKALIRESVRAELLITGVDPKRLDAATKAIIRDATFSVQIDHVGGHVRVRAHDKRPDEAVQTWICEPDNESFLERRPIQAPAENANPFASGSLAGQVEAIASDPRQATEQALAAGWDSNEIWWSTHGPN